MARMFHAIFAAISGPEGSSVVAGRYRELRLVAKNGHAVGSLFGISFTGDRLLGRMFSQEPFYLGGYERHRRLIVQRYVIRTIQYDQLGVGN